MDKLIHKKNNGFSTLELMIALAVISLILTAVVLVLYSDQSFVVGSQTNNEAIKIAQGLLEKEQANARKDFNLVNPTTKRTHKNPDGSDDIYQEEVKVSIVNDDENNPDYLKKFVQSIVTWKTDRGNDRTLELNTYITNFNNPVGNNTCDSTLSGDWTDPEVKNNETDFATLIGNSSGSYEISDMDVYRGKLYVVVSKTSNINDPTFFIFDILDISHPKLIKNGIDKAVIDNAPNVTTGLNAVTVAGNYAYVASGRSVCNSDSYCGQLQIIDVSDPLHLSIVKTYSVPGVSGAGGLGNSIFYKDGFVFLGLTAATGPEFNIIDVHDPYNPFVITNGNHEIAGDVNSILVKNKYAYIATPPNPNNELIALALNDLNNEHVYNAPGNGGNGKSLAIIGNNLYLGRTNSPSDKELYILDNTDPTNLESNNSIPVTQEIGSSVDDLTIRDYLAFVVTKVPELKIFKINKSTNPWTLSSYTSPLTLDGDGNNLTEEPSMDCEGNVLYIGSNNLLGKGYLSVIAPND